MREFIVVSLILLAVNQVGARVFSYERHENTIDDGVKKITNFETKKYDSSWMKGPHVEGKTWELPSRYKSGGNIENKLKLRKQRNTNKVETGFEAMMPMRWFKSRFEESTGHHHRGSPRTRARAVESPAYSVDSGGQASSSIAGEVAKILKIKQGYYADVYNRLDRPPGLTTRRPVDVIEDTMRVAVQKAWSDRRHS